jgi:hypothetical protein
MRVPTEHEYQIFAGELDALADPLRALFPGVAMSALFLPGWGRPGILVHGRRVHDAPYPFPLSILLRWSDQAIEEYVAGGAAERKVMRDSFAGSLPTILKQIQNGHGGVDWAGRSQASAKGIIVPLEEF